MAEYKQKVFDLLKSQKIDYRVICHKAVNTVAEMHELDLPGAEVVAKNLFIRDDKKRQYYLLVVHQEKQVDLKDLRKRIKARPLSLASEKDLHALLGLPKGSVTPFGIINDENHQVKVFIDASFEGTLIGVHPNDNTATVWLKTGDLVDIIRQYGNTVEYLEI